MPVPWCSWLGLVSLWDAIFSQLHFAHVFLVVAYYLSPLVSSIALAAHSSSLLSTAWCYFFMVTGRALALLHQIARLRDGALVTFGGLVALPVTCS
jgi:hypothetical protein